MKKQTLYVTLPICVAILITGTWLVDAGDLNPPVGPVTSTMKDLDTVEPRTPIRTADLPLTINQSGSYYLAENITTAGGGITINADNVTIDLSGFMLSGGTGVGIRSGRKNVEIRNGSVRDWGSEGVNLATATDCRIVGLRASNNGSHGIRAGSGSLVRDCVAESNSSVGIITNSGCTVTACVSRGNLGGGFSLGGLSRAIDCNATSNTGVGIVLGTGSLASGCIGKSNTDDGIRGAFNSVVTGSLCDQNGAAGIHITGRENRIEDNHLTRNAVGLDIDRPDNVIMGNTVRGNTDNYDFVQGNQLNILLCEIPESIDWPANVTLAGSLTGVSAQNGITINSDDVTIDLNGHALIGVAGSLDGIIAQSGLRNLTVRSGTIRDWGDEGVDAGSVSNSQFQDLRVSDNGGTGLQVGSGSLVTHCTSRSNGGDGIFVAAGSVVQNCSGYANGSNGIVASHACTVLGCNASSNTVRGISTGGGCTVRNCTAFDNDDDGFHILGTSTIAGCTAVNNEGDGIEASSNSLIIGNSCQGNGLGQGDGAGIHTTDFDNRIEGNNVSFNDRGIDVDGAGNIIIKNTASGNGTNYDIAADNRHGPIVDVSAVDGDISGTANSDHPWANFSY